jgi:hypothetical protein
MRGGVPAANAPIVLASGKHDGREGDGEWINLRTDAQGRFEYSGPAGTFGLLLYAERGARASFYLRAAEQATTQRGATTTQTFNIARGTLELTVRDAAGRPVPEVRIGRTVPDDEFPPTDREGRVVVETTAGPVALRMLPKSLQSFEARSRFMEERMAGRRSASLETQWIDVANATVVADQVTKLDVRLPPGWEK